MKLLFILLVIYPFIKVLMVFRRVKKSKYMEISGNSLFKSVFNKGNYGEFLTFEYLEKHNDGKHKLLANIYIPKEDGSTTEIDVLMISNKGIFVFESKNFSGWIFGNEKNKMWMQTLKGAKNKFFNPIWQNKGHITALNNYLDNKYADYIYSYIIFSERCTLKNITFTSKNVEVIKRNQLLEKLKTNHNTIVLSDDEVNKIYKMLKKHTLVDDTTKQKHIENILAKRDV